MKVSSLPVKLLNVLVLYYLTQKKNNIDLNEAQSYLNQHAMRLIYFNSSCY